ncbi:6-phosphogluconolactonase [Niveispirillum sp. KHB5.9]|uniref:6-phosphogluconolactonase n=1 Tax=Niveispirillum sp. KHB5.9 TaxID=3400269 RepID=UPI003A842734
MPIIKDHADKSALVTAFADHIAGLIRDAVASHGSASLVLSGGTTPADLFARLDMIDLPWDKVYLTLSDERWVDLDDPASNEAMVRRTLSGAVAKGATVVGLKSVGGTPADGLARTSSRLATMPRPYDLVLLGMGEDSHTASFFPGAMGLSEALSGALGLAVAAVTPAGGVPARITLTLPELLRSRAIALLITGEKKKSVLDAALQPGPVEAAPVRAVLHQDKVPVSIWWAP